MTENNPYPDVNVYKYCVVMNDPNEFSTEELLYQKAELKHQLIKKVERIMKRRSNRLSS